MSLADPSLIKMNTDSHIGKIRELSDRIGPPEGTVRGPGLKQYQTVNGTSLAWTLHWQDEFAVAHAFLSEGTIVKRHAHNEKEWLIVIDGQLMVRTDTEEKCLMPRQETVLEPNVEHEVCCFVDTYVLAITMPAAQDWPKK